VERIRGTATHLLSLIDDVVGLARLESGEVEVEPVDVDLPGLLREVSEMVEPLVQRRGNRFVLGGSLGVGVLVTDPVRVRQMLVHVIARAARVSERSEVALFVESDVEHVRFEVRDRGPELDKAQIEALMSGALDAGGVGLLVARRVAMVLGGDLRVMSSPRGTTVVTRIARLVAARKAG
jgi:signal transduction histidine kinase